MFLEVIKLNILSVFMIYLFTAIGLTPGGSSTVHIYTHTVHRTTPLTQTVHTATQLTNWEECGPCPFSASRASSVWACPVSAGRAPSEWAVPRQCWPRPVSAGCDPSCVGPCPVSAGRAPSVRVVTRLVWGRAPSVRAVSRRCGPCPVDAGVFLPEVQKIRYMIGCTFLSHAL